MLEIRQVCENCGKSLPNDSEDAMICTFECTFCKDCVEGILENVCPNCGGGFEKRPIRPKEMLTKYPPQKDILIKKVDLLRFEVLKNHNKNLKPNQR